MAAATPPLALDMTRLTAGIWRASPRGLDRVELLYARHFLQTWDGPLFSIVTTPWGSRLFDRRQALLGLAIIEAVWGEDAAGRRRWGAVARVSKHPGRSVEHGLPAGAIYLNVGHLALSWPGGLRWMARRPDVRPIFMLHDLIPMEHPQFVTDSEVRYFKRIVRSLGYAQGLLLNSQAVARSPGVALLPRLTGTLIQPLPVSDAFLERRPTEAMAPPYFVAYGQVEPRKNFQMLSEAWRELSADGEDAPTLVIAGAPGHASDALKQSLDSWDKARRHVRLAPRLTTAQLRNLLGGATALLAPSLAEGFGLPLAEALAVGTPVIASDIAPHREVGGDFARYLPPDQPLAWAGAVRGLLNDPAGRAEFCAKAQTFQSVTTEAYFANVEAFLRNLPG